MGSAQEHLSQEEIGWLIEELTDKPELVPDGMALEAARAHVLVCQACRESVLVLGQVQKRIRELRSQASFEKSPDCPSPEELRELAARIMPTDRAERLLDHTIQCDSCSVILREATEDLSESMPSERDVISKLQTAQPTFQSTLAKKLAAVRGRTSIREQRGFSVPHPQSHFVHQHWPWLSAAALALLVIGLAGGFFLFGRRSSTDQLLAKAYSDQRTLELRLPDASPAPIRVQRGTAISALSKPATLLEAELRIKRALEKSPNDPNVLAVKGRAEILEWNYRDALQTFGRALDLSPESSDLQRDIATAYFQRAESEHHAADYATALDYLKKALSKNSQDRVALFNSAIVSERLFLYENASKDWDDYLRLDPSGPWSPEARKRLAELRKKLEEHKQSLRIPIEDPTKAAIDLSQRLPRSGAQEPTGSMDEQYLDIALQQWLPIFSSDLRRHMATPHSAAGTALFSLAHRWQTEHNDAWLVDFLSFYGAPGFSDAADDLTNALTHSLQGQPDEAREAAQRAALRFELFGDHAGSQRARLELIYALQRSLDSQHCIQEARAAAGNLRGTAYRWLQTRVLLEQAACASALEDFQGAQESLRTASILAKQFRFGASELRALSFSADNAEAEGDLVLAWDENYRGFERFWSGSFPILRNYAFLANLGYLAEDSSQWQAASAFWTEALGIVASTQNRSTEGLVRYRLASALLAAGQSRQAAIEFEKVDQLFAVIPQDQVSRNYRVASEVSRAAIESSSGNYLSARNRLDQVQTSILRISQYPTILEYFLTLAQVQAKTGRRDLAERNLDIAIAIAANARDSLVDDSQQLAWDEQAGNSYRSLVGMKLETPDSQFQALRIWEAYRSSGISSAQGDRRQSLRPIPDFSSYVHNPPAPRQANLAPVLQGLSEQTFLTYLELTDGVVFWAYDNRGIQFFRVPASLDELKATARRFARLCADAESDKIQLHADASQLYTWLIAPAAAFLAPGRTLWIEPDGAVTLVPFGALLSRHERPLIADFTIGYRASAPRKHWTPEPEVNHDDNAFVVAISSEEEISASNAPALSDTGTEARAVASRFPNHTVLVENRFPNEAILKELLKATLLHYVGHYSSGDAEPGTLRTLEPSLRTIMHASQGGPRHLVRCKLVVLSACSTGFSEKLGLYGASSPVHSFLLAGARRVVASRWNVDSRVTTILMERFYTRLLASHAIAESLRDASNSIRSNPEFDHPYYWASFELFAED